MTDEMKKKLQTLRAHAGAMNKATDEAAATVREVERFLNETCSLGVSAVTIPHVESVVQGDDGEDVQTQRYLAYGRVGGAFRIHVVTAEVKRDQWGNFEDPAGAVCTPWASCDRETKLQFFADLPELLDNLVRRADQMLEKTNATNATVRELLEAVGAATQADDKPEDEPETRATLSKPTETNPRPKRRS